MLNFEPPEPNGDKYLPISGSPLKSIPSFELVEALYADVRSTLFRCSFVLSPSLRCPDWFRYL
jgi:hypothetical protein